MASNLNTVGQYLEKGLAGRSFKATFLLYAVNLLAIGIIGYWTVKIYGETQSLGLLPVIVGVIISIEYGIHFILTRVTPTGSKRSLEQAASDSLDIKKLVALSAWRAHTEKHALMRFSAKLSSEEEPVSLTTSLASLKSAYIELIEILGNQNRRDETIKHGLLRVILRVINYIAVPLKASDTIVGFLYLAAKDFNVTDLQKRVSAIDSILDLERKLKEHGIEVTQVNQILRKYAYSTQRRRLLLEESAYHQQDLQLGQSLSLIIDKSPSKESSKPKALKRTASAKRTTTPAKKTKKPQKSKKKKNYPGRKH